MGCKDCPEPGDMQKPPIGETYHILYTGGGPLATYLALRSVIPAGDSAIIRQYGHPTITDRGYISYTGGQVPPVPEGWEAIEPQVLRPVWPECARRALRARMEDTGFLKVEGRCLDPRTGHALQAALTLADCQQCPLRQRITQQPITQG